MFPETTYNLLAFVDDDDPGIIYQGSWKATPGPTTAHIADTLYAHYKLSYVFNGEKIPLISAS